MRTLAVMYHDDFDGCASAAILAGFFHQQGVRETRFVPVQFDLKPVWSGPFPLPREAHERLAIVDFLFHPEAEIWFDHHPSTFVSLEYERCYASRPKQLWNFDTTEPSCAQLIYRWLWALQPSLDRYYPLVEAANMIDQADYPSPEVVFALEDPAIAINGVYRRLSGGERSELIRRFMHPDGLAAGRAMVDRYVTEEKHTMTAALAQYEHHLNKHGDVVTLDLLGTTIPFLRYAHFLYYPQAQYGISLYAQGTVTSISLGRNPWNPGPLNMGELAKQFGGGGHEYAAGVSFPNVVSSDPRKVARQLAEALSGYGTTT